MLACLTGQKKKKNTFKLLVSMCMSCSLTKKVQKNKAYLCVTSQAKSYAHSVSVVL